MSDNVIFGLIDDIACQERESGGDHEMLANRC